MNESTGKITVIGDNPEATLVSVLLAEIGNPNNIVGNGALPTARQSSLDEAGDEAHRFLNAHIRAGTIRRVEEVDQLDDGQTQILIITDHADDNAQAALVQRRVHQVARVMTTDQLLLYTGLCPPSFTEQRLGPVLERQSGLKVGEDIGLCYLPLLCNGEALHQFREVPRIIAGTPKHGLEKIQEILLPAFPSLTVAQSISSAETAGLITPVCQDVFQALELELAQVCAARKVDYSNVMRLCGRGIFASPKSTSRIDRNDMLASRIVLDVIGSRNRPLMIRTARRINQKAPQQVLAMVKDALALCGRRMNRSKIAILGVEGLGLGFNDGFRDLEVVRTLVRRGAIISFYPGEQKAGITTPERVDGRPWRVRVEPDLTRAVQKAQCAIIALKPSILESLALSPQKLAVEMDHPAAICDLSGVLEASNVERSGLFYTSFGRGNLLS